MAMLLVLAFAGVLAFSHPAGNFPLQQYDKHLHLLAFAVITIITVWALPTVRLSLLLLGLLLLSGLTEMLQALPSVRREADWLDFAFNAIAIGMTLAIVFGLRWVVAKCTTARH
jgi:hypothetical protein